MKNYTTTLTIAGSDCSGGAGIQADLKTFSALGCYGMSVITALTAQNTLGVRDIQGIPPKFVEAQLKAVFDDIRVDAVKIGMLHSPEIIETVSKVLDDYSVKTRVVDPVMFAKSGDRLIRDDAIEILREKLIPGATVLTPNLPEAAELLKRSIKTRDHMEESAHLLLETGPSCVVLKGGHLDFGGSDDFLAWNEGPCIEDEWFYGRRETTGNRHGTGCTFSSAITAFLAKGLSFKKAVRSAKEYIAGAVEAGGEYEIGKGNGPVAHFYNFWNSKDEGNQS